MVATQEGCSRVYGDQNDVKLSQWCGERLAAHGRKVWSVVRYE